MSFDTLMSDDYTNKDVWENDERSRWWKTVFIEYPTTSERKDLSPIYCGTVLRIGYNDQDGTISKNEICAAPVNVHTDLFNLAVNDPVNPRNLQEEEQELCQIVASGKAYRVSGRYAFDIKNHLLRINLFVLGVDDAKVEIEDLADFENEYFLNCFRTITDSAIGTHGLDIDSLRRTHILLGTTYFGQQSEIADTGHRLDRVRMADFLIGDNKIIPGYVDVAKKVTGVVTHDRMERFFKEKTENREVQLSWV